MTTLHIEETKEERQWTLEETWVPFIDESMQKDALIAVIKEVDKLKALQNKK